ncbi:uncharacterized protein LOC129589628 isoform X2 [Paramacrobiotus metropolitanus]|uniref:uncharacterized protein LOC129589628 isoform X2 n=1 Tax=Paramacrobiotus metropolitanus TaxID=2943436 RepID=UPI002445DC05|nr:uncharacterized protein LOC129589628 isoform X2 [Paramacrobiotus metropolitanus]
MENLLPWRVLKEPLITGAYNSFAVDILESDATYRGYICGMENGQRLCMVRVGSMQQLQVVSIEQLRLVDGSLVFHPETFTEEIDVLVTVQQNRPESWQAGRIVGGVEGDGYLLANVEVNLSDDSVQRYLVLDGPGAAFRRIRRRGHLGPPVTKLSFRHATIPVDSLRLRSAGLTATLTTIQWIPQFRSLFLMQTGEIMFLGVENDRVAVLVAENTETDVTNDEIATSVLRAIYWYSKKSVLAAEFTARSIVEEILCITVAQQALDDPSENRFLGLYKELHVSVFAYLNVYDQHRLRRQLLRDVILKSGH